MFKREKRDNPESKNGFRAKYKPDGQLFINPKAMQFAGRVAKGKPKGCIACHQAASISRVARDADLTTWRERLRRNSTGIINVLLA